MSGSIVTLTSSSFDETIRSSSTPVLVDFWAEWCGPCKAIAPVLDEIAKELEGRLLVTKVNVDDFPELSFRVKPEVRSIPAVWLFKDGKQVVQLGGAKGKQQYLELISPHLS